jgi:hypothetical protein
MRVRPNLPEALSGLLCLLAIAITPASAQSVHKCVSRDSVTYSAKPCSSRIISTEQAGVPVKANPNNVDIHRLEEARVAARALRRKPDESAEQFAVRRRRARLLAADRDECERLDVRMPVEQASMKNPDPAEVTQAEAALKRSHKRFGELHC